MKCFLAYLGSSVRTTNDYNSTLGSMLRDASFVCQDKVFGAGYPGVPTMTQEEYLEKEIMEGKVVLDYKE